MLFLTRECKDTVYPGKEVTWFQRNAVPPPTSQIFPSAAADVSLYTATTQGTKASGTMAG